MTLASPKKALRILLESGLHMELFLLLKLSLLAPVVNDNWLLSNKFV